MSAHTLQQQIDAVAREIKMREYVYPSRVANKKMKQEKADYEIAVMKSIAATLVGLQAVGGATLDAKNESGLRAFRDLAAWGETKYTPIDDNDKELALSVFRRAQLSDKAAALLTAGKELLRLKALKDAYEHGDINDLTMRRDYDENKPLAWAALRAAVLA